MAIRNVLIPVDFSPRSDLAARTGVAIARRLGASVRLIHAVELVPPLGIDPAVQARFEGVVMARTEDAMSRLVASVDGGDVEITASVVRGDVGATLLEHAAEPPASLIVIGSSGAGNSEMADETLFLGSVAARLVRDAGCPVLVLRLAHAARLAGDGFFHRPLVAVDYSRFSEIGIRCAGLLTAPDATVELYHAMFTPRFELVSSGEVDKLFTAAFEVAKKHELEKLAQFGERVGISQSTEPVVEMGRAFELIGEHLEAHDVDLVVTGAHGRETSTDLLIGSVADRLLRASPAPILFIPDGAVDDEAAPVFGLSDATLS